MAGGTFTKLNKRRPGAYINVKAPTRKQATTRASRGLMLYLAKSAAEWGKDGVISLTADSDLKKCWAPIFTRSQILPALI